MLKSSNKWWISLKFPLALALALLLVSCNVLDLRPVIVETTPASRDEVLPSTDTPVSIRYPAEVNKVAAEAALKVEGPSGVVSGDFSWSGNECIFMPKVEWLPASEYRLMVQANVPLIDGRTAKLDIDVRFFALRAAPGPGLLSFAPENEANISVFPDIDAFIELVFSEPMDTASVEKALTISPAVEMDFVWTDGDTKVVCVPDKNLSPGQLYEWSLSEQAKALDGSPVQRTDDYYFTTNADLNEPSVVGIFPVRQVSGVWQTLFAGASVDDFETTSAVGIRFSEAVLADSVATAAKFEPTVQGRLEQLEDDFFVYIPQKDFEPEAEYVFIMGDGLKDLSGLNSGSIDRIPFSIATPWLTVESISTLQAGESLIDPEPGQVLTVTLTDPDGELTLTILFNPAIQAQAATDIVGRISLSGFFPADTASGISLKSAAWLPALPSSTLQLVYTGLIKSTAIQTCYYKLNIPGGPGGVYDGLNSRMREDLELYLETKQ